MSLYCHSQHGKAKANRRYHSKRESTRTDMQIFSKGVRCACVGGSVLVERPQSIGKRAGGCALRAARGAPDLAPDDKRGGAGGRGRPACITGLGRRGGGLRRGGGCGRPGETPGAACPRGPAQARGRGRCGSEGGREGGRAGGGRGAGGARGASFAGGGGVAALRAPCAVRHAPYCKL